jgi:predicted dehydrogenase
MIRWGILGTGGGARDFALGLRHVAGATLQAVGSRTPDRAANFAKTWGAAQSWGTYEQLVADPNVDVVYIATPHNSHKADCLLALAAGKPILCEKPFACTAAKAKEVFDFAKSKNLFCMEALWTRFLPIMLKAKSLIEAGELGQIHHFTAEFGFKVPFEEGSRYFSKQMGGGAMLDRGVYVVSLAHYFLGKPDRVSGMALLGKTGVDEHSSCMLGFPSGATALLSASLKVQTANEIVIYGEKGTLKINAPLYRPTSMTLSKTGDVLKSTGDAGTRPESTSEKLLNNALFKKVFFKVVPALKSLRGSGKNISIPYEGNGYNYEAAEVVRCLEAGLKESPIHTFQDVLEVLETMDKLNKG